MGMQSASIQQSPNPSSGKGSSRKMGFSDQSFVENGNPVAAPAVMPNNQSQQPMGKGASNVTTPGQGGQPRMGQPNAYSNTIQPWDNASIQPQNKSGKGKGY